MVSQALANFFPQLNAQGTDVLDRKKVFSVLLPSFPPGDPSGSSSTHPDHQMTLNFSLPLYSGGRIMSGYNKSAGYNLQRIHEGIAKQETVFNVKKVAACSPAQFREVAQGGLPGRNI